MNVLDFINYLKNEIVESINKIKLKLNKDFENPNIVIEFPAQKIHGDFSTNVSMVCAKKLGVSPRELATLLTNDLKDVKFIQKIEIAGPGFINFFLDDSFYKDALEEMEDENYGKLKNNSCKKILVEYVSSNPTGPMHIGNARLGALGDSLSSVLEFAGYNVCREFYVNDAGNQIKKFSQSLASRYLQLFYPDEKFPEDGYHGDDIKELANEFFNIHGNKFLVDKKKLSDEILKYALPLNINRIKSNLHDYKVDYDNWFYESFLYKSGEIDSTIEYLKNHNATYLKDDTLWFKASEFGAEKDEVLVRKNGIPTYFAADIAYHVNKFLVRKFDICVNFLGADHHGHISRMKAAMRCFGVEDSRMIFIIVQMVRIIKNGEIASMSKRNGTAESLEDFLKIVDVDCARFMFSMYDPNSTMDFDIDLAVKNDASNPSYYVKYACARINSILKLFDNIPNFENINANLLKTESEKSLIFILSMLSYELNEAKSSMNATRIARYALKVATAFHKFYNENKVYSDDKEISDFRCYLCHKSLKILKIVLNILKIDVPERM